MAIIHLHIIKPNDGQSERGRPQYFGPITDDTFDNPVEIPGYTHEVREYDLSGPDRHDRQIGKRPRQQYAKALHQARRNGWAHRSRHGAYPDVWDIVKK